MSLWSDWKAGLLEDSEYTALCNIEDRKDRDRSYVDEEEFEDDDIDEF